VHYLSRRFLTFLIAIALSALSGCDSGGVALGTVSGKITKNGKPQPGVWVRFVPVQPGRQSSGRTDADGNYELKYTQEKKGALVGKHRISLGSGGEVGEGGNLIHPEVVLHSEEVEVHSGANTLNFELTK
jgi:hypothetical protein